VSPRLRAKVDTTHAEIVAALRSVGATVQSLAAIGKGCPDLLVSYRGCWYVMECKSPGGSLTPDQWVWIGQQGALVAIVDTADQALQTIGVPTNRRNA